MTLVVPKASSFLVFMIFFLLTALFSSWVLFEIVIFIFAIGFSFSGVIWPNQELKENPLYFGYFWGMLLGLVLYPLWELSGIIKIIPLILEL